MDLGCFRGDVGDLYGLSRRHPPGPECLRQDRETGELVGHRQRLACRPDRRAGLGRHPRRDGPEPLSPPQRLVGQCSRGHHPQRPQDPLGLGTLLHQPRRYRSVEPLDIDTAKRGTDQRQQLVQRTTNPSIEHTYEYTGSVRRKRLIFQRFSRNRRRYAAALQRSRPADTEQSGEDGRLRSTRPGPARVRYSCNWRSFTEMRRKRNARMCLPGDSAQLAFIHRDVAEKERQFADGGAGAGGTSGTAGTALGWPSRDRP